MLQVVRKILITQSSYKMMNPKLQGIVLLCTLQYRENLAFLTSKINIFTNIHEDHDLQ